MNKKSLFWASLLVLLALFLNFQSVYAHETITVGDYEIVYGWVNEPAIAGQMNGVEIFVSNTNADSEQPTEGHIIHALDAELSYGEEVKILSLEPVGEDPAEGFTATIIPAVPGVYTLKFTGMLGDTSVDQEVELDIVQASDAIQFPRTALTDQQPAKTGTADWLVWLSLLFGLLGVGLGVIALRRK